MRAALTGRQGSRSSHVLQARLHERGGTCQHLPPSTDNQAPGIHEHSISRRKLIASIQVLGVALALPSAATSALSVAELEVRKGTFGTMGS